MRSFGLLGLSGLLGLACLSAGTARAASPAVYDCQSWGQRYDAPALLDRLMRPTHAKHEAAVDQNEHGPSMCHSALRPDIAKILHVARPLSHHAPVMRRFSLERTVHEI